MSATNTAAASRRRQLTAKQIRRPSGPPWYPVLWVCRNRSCAAVHCYNRTGCAVCCSKLIEQRNPNFNQRTAGPVGECD
jgi:hypothetical protein